MKLKNVPPLAVHCCWQHRSVN